MFKQTVLILSVVLVLWLAFNYLSPTQAKPLDAGQAKAFVLDDVKNIAAEKRVLEVLQQEGEWNVDVLLSFNAHSACPTLKKRAYKLLPIRYREETIVGNCIPKSVISYPEEALITSSPLVQHSKSQGAYGCAFYLDKKDEQYSCDKLDKPAFDEFTIGLSKDAWVVYWTDGLQKTFLALDRNANLIKRT